MLPKLSKWMNSLQYHIEIEFQGKWHESDVFESLDSALTVALLKPVKWRIRKDEMTIARSV